MALPGTDTSPRPDTQDAPAPPPRPSWESARPAAPRPAQTAPRPVQAAPPVTPVALPVMPAAPPVMPAVAPPYFEAAAEPEEAHVTYDLAGNPIVSAAPAPPPSPFGYSAGNPAAAGVWPPPAGAQAYGAHPYGAQAYRNNSGEQSHLPPELERLRWHWGAFFFPILWTKNHGLTTIAAMLTGGLVLLRVIRYIAAAIDPAIFWGICGLNGHKIGWRNRHFPGGVEEYFKVQTAWMWWGFGINVFAGPILMFLFFALILGAALGTTHHRHSFSDGSGYSRPYGGANSGRSDFGGSSGSSSDGSSSGDSTASGQ